MKKVKVTGSVVILVVATLFSLVVQAQPESRVGTIDTVMQDDGYIVIDGTRYPLRGGDVQVSYRGRPQRLSFLAPGLSVRYTIGNDGSISRIDLVGPASVLDKLAEQ